MYEVNIDFDEASRAWMQNKIKLDYGEYRYCCSKLNKNCDIMRKTHI